VVYFKNTMGRLNFIVCVSILVAVLLFGARISFGDAAALPAPTSPSPSDGATAVQQPVTLQWSSITFPGGVAGGYLLKVSGGIFGAEQKIWTQTNSHIFTQTLTVAQEHRWRVQACFGFGIPANENEQCGPLSNNGIPWTFFPSLAKAKLISPADTLATAAAVNAQGTINLQWEKVVGADRYNVILKKTSGTPFSTTFENITTTSFSIPSNLINLNDSYTWQVISRQGNNVGPASDLWKFFVALAKPTLESPIGNIPTISDIENIPFTWNVVSQAGGYLLEVLQNGSKVAEAKPSGGTNTSATLALSQGAYEWQVTACGAGFVNCGPTSDRKKFTITKDIIPPRIEMFTAQPNAPAWASTVTVSWRVSDQGGSHIDQVEVWRAADNNNCKTGKDNGCVWEERVDMRKIAPPDTDIWDCSLQKDLCPTESPADGVYWYGIHVRDHAGQWTASNVAKVQVDRKNPDIIAFKASTTAVNIENRSTLAFTYEVYDATSGLKSVELWRRTASELLDFNNPGKYKRNTKSFSGVTEQQQGIFQEDAFPLELEETYVYVLRVIDQADNLQLRSLSSSPVIVDTKIASCTLGAVASQNKKGFGEFVGVVKSQTKAGRDEIVRARWDFGDGTTAQPTPALLATEHEYGKPGTYTATLTLEDKAGNKSSPCSAVIKIDSVDATGGGQPPPGGVVQGCHPSDPVPCPGDLICGENNTCVVKRPGLGQTCNPAEANACAGILMCNRDTKKCELPDEPGPWVFINPLRATTFAAVLNTILNFLFTIALVVAPLAILAGAFLFVTASGNPDQISRAKKTLIWTMIGFIVIMLSRALVSVIQNILGI
jgi:hypothetical protein